MAKEIERKFLCSRLPLDIVKSNIVPDFFNQGILVRDSKHSLRIRIVNDEKAYLTYKFKYEINNREEFEYEIPLEDGLKMLSLCNPTISKNRFNYAYHNMNLSFDVFLPDLITCDIEFETKEEAENFTDWHDVFIKEVTEISQYDLLNNHLQKI
jgi:CYTH domain-containing protein